MEEIKNSYDELLYKSKPFSFSVPVFLQSVSTLLGLNVADSKNCSFLELGSSFGGNMISQALFNPESKFVGIDLSEEQVKIGNEIIEYIGLDNIKLYAKNILDIDEDFGKFDYITTHGVYSWVPDNVKDKILEIFKNNLNENGILILSGIIQSKAEEVRAAYENVGFTLKQQLTMGEWNTFVMTKMKD